jgi:nitrogen-specific signal transduction histidine kinase
LKKPDIYSRKETWKIALGLSAIVIILGSLVYTNFVIRQVASEERNKARIWAEAIRRKANLVKSTTALFDRIRTEERKKVEIWAEASRMLTISESSPDLNFYLKILNENSNIPVILTTENGKILSWKNIEGVEDNAPADHDPQRKILESELRTMRNRNDSIIIPLLRGSYNLIFYRESKLYDELKELLSNQISTFMNEVVESASSVPVIITDSSGIEILAHGNLENPLPKSEREIAKLLASFKSENEAIKVELSDDNMAYIFYKNSRLLNVIKYFPVVQLIVIVIFLFIGYSMFSTSRKAEQNQVWVGMAKETAHQLGTPLSSLIAWNELRKISPGSPDFAEIEKDIQRLEKVTDRFSKIGSVPVLSPTPVHEVLAEVTHYMQGRISERINIELEIKEPIALPCNATLFEWVIENLIRNAVDAMEASGQIIIQLYRMDGWCFIDIKDNGKGIPRSEFKKIFKPGYSTKKRGWGLGLSLARRIIENYHSGKIFVKDSEPQKGTTFRIQLPL